MLFTLEVQDDALEPFSPWTDVGGNFCRHPYHRWWCIWIYRSNCTGPDSPWHRRLSCLSKDSENECEARRAEEEWLNPNKNENKEINAPRSPPSRLILSLDSSSDFIECHHHDGVNQLITNGFRVTSTETVLRSRENRLERQGRYVFNPIKIDWFCYVIQRLKHSNWNSRLFVSLKRKRNSFPSPKSMAFYGKESSVHQFLLSGTTCCTCLCGSIISRFENLTRSFLVHPCAESVKRYISYPKQTLTKKQQMG